MAETNLNGVGPFRQLNLEGIANPRELAHAQEQFGAQAPMRRQAAAIRELPVAPQLPIAPSRGAIITGQVLDRAIQRARWVDVSREAANVARARFAPPAPTLEVTFIQQFMARGLTNAQAQVALAMVQDTSPNAVTNLGQIIQIARQS
jgi:hypothetical protein